MQIFFIVFMTFTVLSIINSIFLPQSQVSQNQAILPFCETFGEKLCDRAHLQQLNFCSQQLQIAENSKDVLLYDFLFLHRIDQVFLDLWVFFNLELRVKPKKSWKIEKNVGKKLGHKFFQQSTRHASNSHLNFPPIQLLS